MVRLSSIALLAVLVSWTTSADAQAEPDPAPTPPTAPPPTAPPDAAPDTAPDANPPDAPPDPPPPPDAPPPLPTGRALANLPADTCLTLLSAHGVTFDALLPEDAPGVRTPVRVHGALGDVTVVPRNDPEQSVHAVLDCRLALAVLAWAPTLRAAHVAKLEHYSAYRGNARVAGRGPVSGHASAMALDAARFHTDDGEVLDVLVDWADRRRGADPCAPRDDEPTGSRTLRSVVCEAARLDLFQVVLTPHHDPAHRNHVHLELRPGVTWSYVH